MSVFSDLAADYPLLYLNPDSDDQETYRRIVAGIIGKHLRRRKQAGRQADNGSGKRLIVTI